VVPGLPGVDRRSPNTVRAYAHDLKDWFTFLGGRRLDWHAVTLEDVAAFVAWLRLPPAARGGLVLLVASSLSGAALAAPLAPRPPSPGRPRPCRRGAPPAPTLRWTACGRGFQCARAVSFTLLQEQLCSVLDTLSEREAGMVSMRFGLTDDSAHHHVTSPRASS